MVGARDGSHMTVGFMRRTHTHAGRAGCVLLTCMRGTGGVERLSGGAGKCAVGGIYTV